MAFRYLVYSPILGVPSPLHMIRTRNPGVYDLVAYGWVFIAK